MIKQNECRRTRHHSRVRRGPDAIDVEVDAARLPVHRVMMKSLFGIRQRDFGFFTGTDAVPARHFDDIRALAFDLEIDFGLTVIDEGEAGRNLSARDGTSAVGRSRRGTRSHRPVINAIPEGVQGLHFCANGVSGGGLR